MPLMPAALYASAAAVTDWPLTVAMKPDPMDDPMAVRLDPAMVMLPSTDPASELGADPVAALAAPASPMAPVKAPATGCTIACTIGRNTSVLNMLTTVSRKFLAKLLPDSKPRMSESVRVRSMDSAVRFHSAAASLADFSEASLTSPSRSALTRRSCAAMRASSCAITPGIWAWLRSSSRFCFISSSTSSATAALLRP